MKMTDLIRNAFQVIGNLNSEGAIKIVLLCVCLPFLWPIIQSYSKIYDISMINRLDDSCEFATLIAEPGSRHIRGSSDSRIASKETHHYQVVPSWRGVYGSDTLLIRIIKNSSASVIIPVYNSGDIQRSRIFFIETNGVREFGTEDFDAWTWSEKHQFGQQGN